MDKERGGRCSVDHHVVGGLTDAGRAFRGPDGHTIGFYFERLGSLYVGGLGDSL
jgi:hypothetical protein